MFRAVQKICRNGTSAHINLSRPMLFAMKLLPGDQVEVTITEDGVVHLRPWVSVNAYSGRSPGVIHEKPEALTK